MNSINTSTGFSNFQIRLSRSPRIIPPIVPNNLAHSPPKEEETIQAQSLIIRLHDDVAEAKDNLLQVMVFQLHFVNKNWSPEIPFNIGNKVMLLILHHHRGFKCKGDKRAAKFFP